MKRIITSLITISFVLTLFMSSHASTNMIINGDFEGTDMTHFEDLQLGMPDNQPLIVSGGRTGKAIQMGGDVDGFGWPAWINFRIGNLTLEKGKSYFLSGWVKGTEELILDVQCHLFNNLVPPNRHREVYHPIALVAANNGVSVTTSWTKFEINFTMTNPNAPVEALIVDATDWNIFFQYATPQDDVTFPVSSILFDDLYLVEVFVEDSPTPAASPTPVASPTPAPTTAASPTPASSSDTSSISETSSEDPITSSDESSDMETEISTDSSSISDESSNVETESSDESSFEEDSSSIDSNGSGSEENSNVLLYVIIGLVVLAGTAAGVYFFILKK